MDADTQSEA
jgi:hypothetical protein